MVTIKKTELEKAAKELNKVLGLDPQINTRAKIAELKEQIMEAAGLIEEGDLVSEKTLDIIGALEDELAEQEDYTAGGNKVIKLQPGAEKDEDDDDEDEDEDDEDTDDDSSEDDEDDDDEDDEDDDEEEAPPAKSKDKKGGKSAKDTKDTKGAKDTKDTKGAKAPKTSTSTGSRPTKKSIVERFLDSKKGGTIEQMAQAMVDEGVDPDYDMNFKVAKLWLNKMGYKTTKAVLAENPVFKRK